MNHSSQRSLGLVLFFTFAAFVIASATTLPKPRKMNEGEASWTNVPTPRDMVGKDQWYQRQQ